jgi:hypothetical protein
MELKAKIEDIDILIAEQGWNDKSMFDLLLFFVEEIDMIDSLYFFLQEQAKLENDFASDN